MRKFWRLVINEYIKTIGKTSTKVMLILVVLGAIGFPLMFKVTEMVEASYDYGYDYDYYGDEELTDEEMAKQELKDLKSELSKLQQKSRVSDEEEAAYISNLENQIWSLEFQIEHNLYKGWQEDAIDILLQFRQSNETGEEINTSYDDSRSNDSYSYSSYSYSSYYNNEGSIFDTDFLPTTEQTAKLEQAIIAGDFKTYLQLTQIDPINATDAPAEIKDVRLFEANKYIELDVQPYSGYSDQDEENWKTEVISNTAESYKTYYEENAKDPSEQDAKALHDAKQGYLGGKYQLENDIEVANYGTDTDDIDYESFWGVFFLSSKAIVILSLLMIMIAGGIVSSEFSQGTVKFFVINPVRRWKLVAAKYVAVLSFAVVMLVGFYIVTSIVTAFCFGFGEITAPYLTISGETVHKYSSFWYVAKEYLLQSISPVVMSTFAFAISSLAKSSALAIGLSTLFTIGGATAVQMFAAFNIDPARYLVFANTNLRNISEQPYFIGQTVGFAVGVIVIYMVIFLLTALDGFIRRDIK